MDSTTATARDSATSQPSWEYWKQVATTQSRVSPMMNQSAKLRLPGARGYQRCSTTVSFNAWYKYLINIL